MDIKDLLSDKENNESAISASEYSDDDSILPNSSDSEEERNYLKSFEQKKISLSKCTDIKTNPESKDVMIDKSLQGRRIVKIGEEWFSHPMHDNRSSPESSSSDERNEQNDIHHKAKNKTILKDQVSSCIEEIILSSSTLKAESEENDTKSVSVSQQSQNHCELSSNIIDLTVETTEESEQFDELCQEREVAEIEIGSEPSRNSVVDLTGISDEESEEQIDELQQDIEDDLLDSNDRHRRPINMMRLGFRFKKKNNDAIGNAKRSEFKRKRTVYEIVPEPFYWMKKRELDEN